MFPPPLSFQKVLTSMPLRGLVGAIRTCSVVHCVVMLEGTSGDDTMPVSETE